MIRLLWTVIACSALMIPGLGHAQAQGARQAEVIEIRGQVPTPQVVTVRPRAVPSFAPDARVARALEPSGDSLWTRPAMTRGVLAEVPLDSAPPVIAAGAPPPIVPPDPAPASGEREVAGIPDPNADAAAMARQQEIAAIREEIELRKARLDSLEQVIRRLGTPDDLPRRGPSAPPNDSRPPRQEPASPQERRTQPETRTNPGER